MYQLLGILFVFPLIVLPGIPFQIGQIGDESCVPPPSGMVSWWSGDGHARDIWDGNSGQPHDGVSYTRGKVGLAMTFDGIDDGIAVADAENLSLTDSLSIEAWVWADSLPSYFGGIFFRGDDRLFYDPYYLAIMQNGTVRFHIEDSPTALNELTAPISLAQWTHIAATLDGNTGLMRLYINGVLADELVTTVRPLKTLYQTYNAGIGIGNGNWYLPYPLYNDPFPGKIDELSVYRRALTAAEVQAIVAADSAGKCKTRFVFLPMMLQ